MCKFAYMEAVFQHLITMAGTALISFGIAWLKKRTDIKDLKEGRKGIDDV